jgi:hypothetical protein
MDFGPRIKSLGVFGNKIPQILECARFRHRLLPLRHGPNFTARPAVLHHTPGGQDVNSASAVVDVWSFNPGFKPRNL